MRIGFTIFLSCALAACAEGDRIRVLKSVVQSVQTRNNVTEIVFQPYQYEEQFCRYEALLLRDLGGGDFDRNWRTFIRENKSGDCGLKLDGYTEIATADPVISTTFNEAISIRKNVLDTCLSSADSYTACPAFAASGDDDVIAIEGPAYSMRSGQSVFCFEYWLKEREEDSTASYIQEICADKTGPVSIERHVVLD